MRWEPDITINIRNHRTGRRHKIELRRGLFGRVSVRYNRRRAQNYDTTLTIFMKTAAKWLGKMLRA